MTTVRAEAPALDLAATGVRARGLQRSEHRTLLAIGDAICGGAAVLLALWAWSITTGFPFDVAFVRRWSASLLVVPVWVLLLSGSRRPPAAMSLPASLRSVFRASVVLLTLYAAGYFYAPPQALPRLPALYVFWEAVLLTLAWRVTYVYVFTAAGFRRRAIVVGTGPAATRIVAVLRDLSPDVDVIATIDTAGDMWPVAGMNVPVPDADSLGLGHFSDVVAPPALALERVLVEGQAAEIVVATNTLPAHVIHELMRWQERGVAVVPMASEYEHLLRRVPIDYLPSGWMFTSLPEWVRMRDASNAGKRLVDIGGAVVGAAMLLLLLPIIAALVWFESGRPVFYRQVRLGAGGRPFQLVKFRSMVRNAEEAGPRWAEENDRRVTGVGRWLRRSRLDELPQVLNVLRGDMSLVGPRPERPEFADQLECAIPFYRARLMVRPGVTGWAQVNTRYGASTADAALKLEYDLYYIKHRSLLFDLWILARTAGTVLTFRGR